jgi:DNA adenine methylase
VTTANNNPPLKWHGGKHYLARRIIERMPPHLHYVEPFFGGGQVLFARDPADPRLWWPEPDSDGRPVRGVSELVNDRHGDLMNFYAVLKDPALFESLRHRLGLTLHSEAEWGRRGGCCPARPATRSGGRRPCSPSAASPSRGG